MSGPLRRLAKGLSGEPPARIHTRARLPFAPAPELLPLQSAHEYTATAVADGQAETAGPTPLERSSGLVDEGSADGTSRADGPISPAAPERPVPSPATPVTGLRQTDRNHRPPSTAADMGAQQMPLVAADVAGRRGRDALEPPSAKSGPTPDARRDRDAAGPPDQGRGGQGDDRPGPAPRAPRPERRATEMPQAVVTTRLGRDGTQDPAAGHRVRASAPPPPEPTEVHVHIGRIEVTAVPEPKTPRKAPRRTARAPMSLDEYLNKRDEGR